MNPPINPLELLNPLALLIIVAMLGVATWVGRPSAAGRRLLAVVIGSLAGYGAGMSVNAILYSLWTWHPIRSGSVVQTGDIMSGLMIAGAGVGLLASLFIRAGAVDEDGDGRRASGRTTDDELAEHQAVPRVRLRPPLTTPQARQRSQAGRTSVWEA